MELTGRVNGERVRLRTTAAGVAGVPPELVRIVEDAAEAGELVELTPTGPTVPLLEGDALAVGVFVTRVLGVQLDDAGAAELTREAEADRRLRVPEGAQA